MDGTTPSQAPVRAGNGERALTDKECRLISDLVYQRFGIVLGQRKRALIASRLQRALRQRGLRRFKDYYDLVLADPSGAAMEELVARLTTNHTAFFREHAHFELLRQRALPALLAETRRAQRELRFWSAGCASGEEAYTLALVGRDALDRAGDSRELAVLATDISRAVLETARRGRYSAERVAAIPPALRERALVRAGDGTWRVSSRLQEMVLFRRLNLLRPAWPFRQPFHVIFCRNVMIYFDAATRAQLVRRLHAALVPGGFLFLGHAETIGRDTHPFEYLAPAVYRRSVGAP